jgi:N-acyl amino acid synthase of PEP-CTERM/exosortase system
MRLVLPRAVDFPIERLGCLWPGAADRLRRRRCGEISRICVIRSPASWMYQNPLAPGLGHVPKGREFEVLLGMLRAIWAHGLGRGIEHCYLIVTEPFARLLRRFGVALRPVGDPFAHRGTRTPYVVDLRESGRLMCRRSPAVHALFARETLAWRRGSAIDPDAIDPDSLLIGSDGPGGPLSRQGVAAVSVSQTVRSGEGK